MIEGLSLEHKWQRLAHREGPFVLWDRFGLSGHSGVAKHGMRLFSALGEKGAAPVLIPGPSRGGGGVLGRVRDSKLVWTRRLSQYLEGYSYLSGSIVHGLSNFNIPRSGRFHRRFKSVLTVHDVIPLLAPSDVSLSSKVQLQYCLTKLEPYLDMVVCVSEWTENALLERFPAYKGRTLVIPNGCPKVRLPDTAPTFEGFRLLSVARYERYKNFDLLFEIVRHLGEGCFLNLVTDDVGFRYSRERAGDLCEDGRLTVFRNLSDRELSSLYANSQVYLQPSRLEGYCLPLTEALTCGVPCVYTSGSGMDEVAGDEIAIPMSPSATGQMWAREIARACGFLKSSDYYEKLGNYLKQKPSWGKVADMYLKLYAKLV